MKSLINQIFTHESLSENPPVLLDIGASGSLPKQWEMIAPYSICIAFDADERDFVVEESEGKECKKLYSLNRIVAPQPSDGLDFYLTKSPYCSSALQPNIEALERWDFQHLFQVERSIKLPAVDLNTVLKQINVDRIDWYKTDSQGTDLRIFKSLPDELTNRIIVADFEPGILDAYIGEDKLHEIMAHMESKPFWVSHMEVKGPYRVHQNDLQKMDYFQQRGMRTLLKTSPGWCEIDYFNSFEAENLTIREYLLGWVFATIKQQHGFAMRIATLGEQRFEHVLFTELYAFSKSKITFSSLELAYVKLRRLAARLLGRP